MFVDLSTKIKRLDIKIFYRGMSVNNMHLSLKISIYTRSITMIA